MDDAVIRLRDLHKAFGAKLVLDGADLDVKRGETIAVLGASGSGKSVLLKTMNGLVPPDSGTVEVLGHDVARMPEKELVPLRIRISYLFQGGALFDSMNVFDNLAFPIREHLDIRPDELVERVRRLLGMVQLEDVDHLMPSELSGGMRKRVALARALALEPEIILYDEPTTGLDPVTGNAIAELIVDLHRRLGVTSVVVTHDIPLVLAVVDRLVFLERGRFVFSGTVEEARRAESERVRAFFNAGGGHA